MEHEEDTLVHKKDLYSEINYVIWTWRKTQHPTAHWSDNKSQPE